jgi:hypothetical protein
VALVGLLLPLGKLYAQMPPLVGQPATDFYGASGTAVKVAWRLDRTTVPEDETIVATLTITGATNPQQIRRPDLKKLPEFQDRFTITDGTDPPPAADATVVQFTYQLRPRNRQVDKVPTLKFRWYNPAAAVSKQYPTARAEFIPITVTEPAPKPAPPSQPLDEPADWFVITTGPTVLTRSADLPTAGLAVAVALGPPAVAAMWYLAWRRWYPDAARLARLRRSRAATRALSAIRKARRTDDPAGSVARAVLEYLRERYGIPDGVATPGEVVLALEQQQVPEADREVVAQLLQRCDAARYAPGHHDDTTLTQEAEAVVGRLEAV